MTSPSGRWRRLSADDGVALLTGRSAGKASRQNGLVQSHGCSVKPSDLTEALMHRPTCGVTRPVTHRSRAVPRKHGNTPPPHLYFSEVFGLSHCYSRDRLDTSAPLVTAGNVVTGGTSRDLKRHAMGVIAFRRRFSMCPLCPTLAAGRVLKEQRPRRCFGSLTRRSRHVLGRHSRRVRRTGTHDEPQR